MKDQFTMLMPGNGSGVVSIDEGVSAFIEEYKQETHDRAPTSVQVFTDNIDKFDFDAEALVWHMKGRSYVRPNVPGVCETSPLMTRGEVLYILLQELDAEIRCTKALFTYVKKTYGVELVYQFSNGIESVITKSAWMKASDEKSKSNTNPSRWP